MLFLDMNDIPFLVYLNRQVGVLCLYSATKDDDDDLVMLGFLPLLNYVKVNIFV